MALIDDVKAVCDDLAPHGWKELLLAHGVDITVPANKLAAELAKEVTVDRRIAGFQDLGKGANGKNRGIEPGKPAFSVLYHALASPNVTRDPAGATLRRMPTLRQIETVENYVFAAGKKTLAALVKTAKDRGLTVGVVVFSYEYRAAHDTCHERHADLVFARTGLSRVGNKPPLYDGATRGFLPFDTGDPFGIRVLPARYAAFLAYRQKGDQANFCPMRFGANPGFNDATGDFWVPVHKLFAGSECLTDVASLTVTLTARHLNEKIARVHKALGNPNKLTAKQLTEPPYAFESGIAELSTSAADPSGFLVPVVHPRLCEPVDATLLVKKNSKLFSSSLNIDRVGDSRRAPEYVNIRHVVNADGTELNLNEMDLTEGEMTARLLAGNFQARHYADFCGEGSITASVPALAAAAGKNVLPAYSLVTPPDFFPSCDQRELTAWTNSTEVPEQLRGRIWAQPPRTLSDQRIAANLQLPWKPFAKGDRTMTAIVPLFGEVAPAQAITPRTDPLRHSHLSDDAAGVFAPGWDVGKDDLQGTEHLAGYSLGSPFPEDAKLCAALSTFWPAVAPDNTRQLPRRGNLDFSVSPLTDEEIGQVGTRPWDGVMGPVRITDGSQAFAEFDSFAHVDYVDNALDGKFSLSTLGRIDSTEYKSRVLASALVHFFLEADTGLDPTNWFVLSFRRLNPGDEGQRRAEDAAGAMLLGQSYRFEIYQKPATLQQAPQVKRKQRIPLRMRAIAYVDPSHSHLLLQRENGQWRSRTL